MSVGTDSLLENARKHTEETTLKSKTVTQGFNHTPVKASQKKMTMQTNTGRNKDLKVDLNNAVNMAIDLST